MAMKNVLLFLAMLAFTASAVSATEYIVGDDYGWGEGYYYDIWAEDKTFFVGDVLVFNYKQGSHTVVKVNGTGFAECQTTPNSGVLTSGNDIVTLTKPGNKWYICGAGDHCSYGQKLKITVYPSVMEPSMPPFLPQVPIPAPLAEPPTPSAEPPCY